MIEKNGNYLDFIKLIKEFWNFSFLMLDFAICYRSYFIEFTGF